MRSTAALRTLALCLFTIPLTLAWPVPAAADTPLWYVHGGVGLDMANLSSSDVKSLFNDNYGIGLDLPSLSLHVRTGYKNLVQAEYRLVDGSHDFRESGFVPGGGFMGTGIGIVSEVQMSYEAREILVKGNPFFRRFGDRRFNALFLTLGTADIEWRDDASDGFDGSSTIIGLEYGSVAKRGSWTSTLRVETIDFDRLHLLGIPIPVSLSGTRVALGFSFGFGGGRAQ